MLNLTMFRRAREIYDSKNENIVFIGSLECTSDENLLVWEQTNSLQRTAHVSIIRGLFFNQRAPSFE